EATMATKKTGLWLETEFQRYGLECQWERMPELVKQLLAKLIANDYMAELLLGELKLEQYLKEHALWQGASRRDPRPQLTEVREHLTAALDLGNLKSEFLQEYNLIMAKLNYVEGDYKEALNIYARVGLDDLPLTAFAPYRLPRLCLEKLAISSSTSNAHVDQEQDVITCYEKAGDIALLYLQEMERNTNSQNRSPKPGPARQHQELGFFLETGLKRAHVLYFKNGNLTRGVESREREILRAVQTRTTQTRQLAEMLLRGMCEQSYWNPLEDPPCQSPLDDPLWKAANTKACTLIRKARVYSGENIFCPQENTEEALLLLLISEPMAKRGGYLSTKGLAERVSVCGLLTIALGRRGQYELLSEYLERAMKFAFEEFQLWYQFALLLMAAGKSARALKVLKECIHLKPDDDIIPIPAAKLCVGSLRWLEEAEKFAKTVVDVGEKTSEFKAKGYLALGLKYNLQSTDASLEGRFSHFRRATTVTTDHSSFYWLCSLHSRQIPEALGYIRQTQLQGNDANSLHLLAFLLSAQEHHHDALNIIDTAPSEYPESFILLFSKVKLESLYQPDEALFTCKHMLQVWKSSYNLTNPSDSGNGSSLLDRAIANRQQLNTITLPDFSDPKTGCLHATSVAASRVEQTLCSSAPKQGPLHPWMTLAQIWLHTAEAYIGIGKPAEATACAQKAAKLFPMSHNVLYMARLLSSEETLRKPGRWYEEALSISPTHMKSMKQLALILHQLGRYSLAEKILRDAVQVNLTVHKVWNGLGEVLQAQGNNTAATERFLTPLELEASSPAVPFTIIPRVF
uniref:Tetratricopeptide repeat protein 7 N-terminal domain-containing protein n=1 Tax=Loxodonta africana TaxID=9785 RepID=G3UAD4_LOXAF